MNVVIIDTDPWNSLGNSVTNDINNFYKLTKKIYSESIITIFSDNKNIMYTTKSTKEFKREIGKILSDIKPKTLDKNGDVVRETLVVFITGHGSQTPDLNKDESDGLDEVVYIGDCKYKDDELNAIFLYNDNYKFIGIVDTCHSGTMFDLRNIYIVPEVKKNNFYQERDPNITTDAISLSSCSDNELSLAEDSGGSLMIFFMRDLEKLEILLSGEVYKIYWSLYKELQKYGQIPVLSYN
jgi:metacaspase-1